MLKNVLSTVGYLLAGFILAIIVKDYVGQGYNVVGQSMYPTLNDGDYVIAQKINKNYEVGDIIVLTTKDGVSIVKRIVAIEGDYVEIKDGVLYINNIKQNEPYIKEAMFEDFKKVQVQKGKIFVLGDNRNNSSDSRYYDEKDGPFSVEDVDGKLWVRVKGGFEKFD